MPKESNSTDTKEENTRINRRTLLSSIGSVGATVGLIGASERTLADSSKRKAELQELAAKYDSKPAVTAAVTEFASPIIAKLFRDGHLDTRNADELVAEPNSDSGTHVKALAGTTENRALIALRISESVTVQVEPEREFANAFVEDGDTTKILDTRAVSRQDDGVDALSYITCCSRYTDCVLSGGPNELRPGLFDIYCCGDACTECRYEYVGGCYAGDARDPPVCQSANC